MTRKRSHVLHRIPAPAHWLRQELNRQGMAQATVARLLQVDKAQVSRWLNGHEGIPTEYALQLSRSLRQPLDYIQGLLLVDDLLRVRLPRAAKALEQAVEAPEGAVCSFLLNLIDDMLKTEVGLSDLHVPRIATHYLLDAIFAARALVAAPFEKSESFHILTVDTIDRHLRYPTNAFVARLAFDPELSTLSPIYKIVQHESQASLRRSAKTPSGSSPLQSLIQHHAIHLLARCGSKNDRELVQELSSIRQNAPPMMRRLAYMGLLLSGQGENIADRFLAELHRDEDLAAAHVLFDAYHYGDMVCPPEDILASKPTTFTNTLRHAARHIKSGADQMTDAINAVKIQLIAAATTDLLCSSPTDVVACLRSLEARVEMRILSGPTTKRNDHEH